MKFRKYINKQEIKSPAGLDISRPLGWAGRGLVLVLLLLLVGCRQEDDTVILQPEPHRVEKIVAVVAPLSANAYTKERLERTAQWFQEHFAEAQQGDSLQIRLQLEWHDELTEDLTTLSHQLAGRDDIQAVIGPFANESVARFAPACQKTQKPLIAPTATSEEIVRRYAVPSWTALEATGAFLWTLTEPDIAFIETMMALFRTWLGKYPQAFDIPPTAAVFSPDDQYGQTFFDWAPFHARNLGLSLVRNEQYADDGDLKNRLDSYLRDLREDMATAFFSSNFCVIETTRQMCDVARLRRKNIIENYPQLTDVDGNPSWNDPSYDRYWDSFEGFFRTWFGFSSLSAEAIASLDDRDKAMLQGYQGFSPYADPATGFEAAYTAKFGSMPTFAECKFYDALLLTAMAACYQEVMADELGFEVGYEDEQFAPNPFFNSCILALGQSYEQATEPGNALWQTEAMRDYIRELRTTRQLKRFCGASGHIVFDVETSTQIAQTTYVHWQLMDGKIYHRTYFGPEGKLVVSPSASWNLVYDEETANKDFKAMAGNVVSTIPYPELTDQYAVLVQGSVGGTNYRHLADVLSVYQLLRRGGFDDDHIVLILDSQEAARHGNVIHSSYTSNDLMGGTDGLPQAVVDYDNRTLSAVDVSRILKDVAPAGETSNVLFYWSGHGRSLDSGGINEFEWLGTPGGQGFTDDLLRQTADEMLTDGRCRKLLVIAEPCYAEATVNSLNGINGVLAIVGASTTEQSWADNWNGEGSYWMSDRFTQNVVEQLTANPAITYSNLFLYCARHTLGSHAKIVNAAHFGNLYTDSPQEFITRQSSIK